MSITYRLEMSTVWVKIVSMANATLQLPVLPHRLAGQGAGEDVRVRARGLQLGASPHPRRPGGGPQDALDGRPVGGTLRAQEDRGLRVALRGLLGARCRQSLRHLKGAWGRCFAKKAGRPSLQVQAATTQAA